MKIKNGVALIVVAITSFYVGKTSQHWQSNDNVEDHQKVVTKSQTINEASKPVYKMPSQSTPDIELLLKSKNEEITKLTQQLSTIKEQYQHKIEDLNTQLSDVQSALPIAESNNQDNKEVPLTQEEVEKYLTAPFSTLMIGTNRKAKALFHALNGEKENEEWAFTITNQINDFIQMHEFSNQLTSFNTECNGSTCQISGIEMEADIWAKIEVDLKAQDWWQFNYLRSATANNQEQGRFFYVLAGSDS